MVSYLTRSIEHARQQKKNLLILQIDSPGGIETAGDRIADKIAAIKDMKTVAYIDDRATGVAALVPLACRDIVFKKGAQHGRRPPDGQRAERVVTRPERLHPRQPGQEGRASGRKGEGIPRPSPSPWSIPTPRSSRPRTRKTGASRLILRSEAEADRGRFQIIQTRKEAGSVLTVDADDAASYGLGQVVNDDEELKDLYGRGLARSASTARAGSTRS